MSLAQFPHRAWLSEYGREDEAQAAAARERRELTQRIVEQISADYPELTDSLDILRYTDFHAAMVEAVTAGMENTR